MIYEGPRGGLFVLAPDGSKIRLRTSVGGDAKKPSPAVPDGGVDTSRRNSKGRVIYEGPRGGLFVLAPDGSKIRLRPSVGGDAKKPSPAAPKAPPAALDGRKLAETFAREWLKKTRNRTRPPGPTTAKNRKLMYITLPRIQVNQTTLNVVTRPSTLAVPVFDAGNTDTSQRVKNARVIATRSTNFDESWFTAQADYISKLPLDDLLTVVAYTVRSHQWIGPWQRSGAVPGYSQIHSILDAHEDGHVMPLYPQLRDIVDQIGEEAFKKPKSRVGVDADKKLFMNSSKPDAQRYRAFSKVFMLFTAAAFEEALAAYDDDLSRVIAAAPPVKKAMAVYRGDHGTVFTEKGEKTVGTKFMSTSFVSPYASVYGSNIQRFVLLPGTRALLLAVVNRWDASGENEVVLNKGAKYLFKKRRVKRWVMTRMGYSKMTVNDIYVY